MEHPKSPQVSLGMPVYNGENFVSEAIRSILEQDFDDFELVITDNASTDRTADICLEFARQDQARPLCPKRTQFGRRCQFQSSFPAEHRRIFQMVRAR